MKTIGKEILKKLGLFKLIKKSVSRIARKRELKKYRNINEWKLEIGSLNLRFDTSDSYSKRWFYPRYDNGNIHEPIATKIFLDYIQKDSEVLDIGGHIGYFSCIAGALANDGNIHVFEVDPQCVSFIGKNLKLNSLNNVKIHNFAVSDKNEVVNIPKLKHPNPSLKINTDIDPNSIEVKAVVIDKFVTQHDINPDFIKIDVEGAEFKVLKGMRKLLKKSDITILVEIHVKILRDHFNTDYKDIIRFLLENNFAIENIDHRLNKSLFRTIDTKTELHGNTMLLCRKKNYHSGA